VRKKSFAEHVAQGTYRHDRHNFTNPKYPSGAACPRYLKGNAKREWQRVAGLLEEQGVLKEIDQSLLASYCQMFAHWRASEADIAKNGLVLAVESTTRTGRTVKPIQNPAVRNSVTFHRAMMQTAVKFGINPLDRPRIAVPTPASQDHFHEDDTSEYGLAELPQ
jgi:P27 family predicted phage terminase small subunit